MVCECIHTLKELGSVLSFQEHVVGLVVYLEEKWSVEGRGD